MISLFVLLLSFKLQAAHAVETELNCAITNEIPRMGGVGVQYELYFFQRKDKLSVHAEDFSSCKRAAIARAEKLIIEGKFFRAGKAEYRALSGDRKKQVYAYSPLSMVESKIRKLPPINDQHYTLKDCEVADLHEHPLKNDGTRLLTECTPDTLYGWDSVSNVQASIQALKSSTSSDVDVSMSLTRNPISKYAYGSTLMRVKLKPGTRIEFSKAPDESLCKEDGGVVAAYQSLNTEQGDDAVTIVEYIVCSTRDIESISFAQPELMNEALRDFQWIRSHYPDQYDTWFHYSKLRGNKNIDSLYFNDELNRLIWEKELLLDRILLIGLMSTQGAGEIATRPGQTDRAGFHFQTDKPTYFHP